MSKVYGNMEEFLHRKRSAIRVIDGNDKIYEGIYLDYSFCFSIVTDNNIEIEQPFKSVSFMVWHRTKWVTYGMKK